MHLHLDPFSGIAGDMLLGCLLDLGAPLARVQDVLASCELGLEVQVERVMRGALAGSRALITAPEDHQHARHLSDVLALLESCNLDERGRGRARATFEALADAEARVHGCSREQVHFHEVGALDAIGDVFGCCAALDALGVARISSAPPTLGGPGRIRCEHGLLPIPAPAVLHLLEGWPLRSFACPRELTTPTGAALLAACARPGDLPSGRLLRNGYGAGSRDAPELPNVLRGVLLASAEPTSAREVTLLETNIDDQSAEQLAFAAEQLREAGALDVWLSPILMKKGRPGHLLSVLAAPGSEAVLEACIFRHTSSFGLRKRRLERSVLERSFQTVAGPWGNVRVKLGWYDGQQVAAAPEYEDLKAAAQACGRPLHELAREVLLRLEKPAGGAPPAACDEDADSPGSVS